MASSPLDVEVLENLKYVAEQRRGASSLGPIHRMRASLCRIVPCYLVMLDIALVACRASQLVVQSAWPSQCGLCLGGANMLDIRCANALLNRAFACPLRARPR